MAVQVIVELTLTEDGEQSFREFMQEILPHTRAQPGCINLEFTRNQDDPKQLLMAEKWDTRADYEKYLAWRMESGVMNRMAGIITGEPSVRVFDYMGL